MNRIFVLSLLCCGVVFPALAEESRVSQLSVRGEASLQVKPDQLMLNLGVTSEAVLAQQALDANNKKMNAVLNALKKLDLGKDEYQTGQFQVQPVWSQRPRNPAEDWAAKITGFRVLNNLSVETKKLQLAGEIIADATKAGANTVHSVQFGLADPRAHRAAAIKQAMQHAETDAKTLASASGTSIKRTLSINLDNADAMPMVAQFNRNAMRGAMAMDSSAPPIEAGDVTVNASVSVVYELK